MHNKQATTGSGGGRWYWDIRCLFALEGALGRVGTPPAAVAALGRRVVDTGLVIAVDVGDDRGGGGGRDDGGWRHFFVVGRSRSQVTLGWEDCCGGDVEEDQPAFISEPEGHPRNRYIRQTKFGRSLSLSHRSPAVPSSS